jgi:ABC-type polysaccharide/polyol phosphate transport system ATPase subunit
MSSFSVKLTNIEKKYIISRQRANLIRNFLGKSETEEFWALKKVNLTIKEGGKVGIFGPNGAGKTTLLKIISGISSPTTGKVETNGKIVSLIDLQAGFHPELTGRENILLNGLLSGMNKDEIKRKENKIIRFAGIGKFINTPFYTYSSGMKFRLAFSIAALSECEILMIDDIFVSSDIDFQRKTLEAIKEIQKRRNITTILCSHFPAFIWEFAETYYELDKGVLKSVSKKEVFKKYKAQDKAWKQFFYLE